MSLPTAAQPVAEYRGVDSARFEAIKANGQPAVLKALVSDWPIIDQQTDSDWADYLRQLSLEQPLEYFAADADSGGLFTFTDDLKQFNFDRRQTTVSALLDALLKPNQQRFIYAGAINVPNHMPGFADSHRLPLLDANTEHLTSVWLGNRTRVPTHWDLPQNLACVTRGRRRFTLFPISQIPNLYIGPLDITIAGQPSSLVDPYAPDLTRFPRFADAVHHAQVAELEPGDAIYLPSLWLHHVESLDDIGMLVNFWWREGKAATQFTPMHTLLHALLSIRDLPAGERAAWRTLFDHYVFQTGDNPAAHLPPARAGVVGPLSAQQQEQLCRFLANQLMRR